jgi:hypothetical protein
VSARANPLHEARGPGRGVTWPRVLRWAVNLWLVFHITAIIIAPASVTPSSAIFQAGWDLVHPYLQILNLNNGYHFFAPEPGDSTLLAFEAQRVDGTVVRGRIPGPDIVPRLLYHRHFMLTEHMTEAPEELQQEWVGSYATHIRQKYGAARVKLMGQIHHLATMDMVRQGKRLDDPASYEDEDLGVFE